VVRDRKTKKWQWSREFCPYTRNSSSAYSSEWKQDS